MAPLGFVSFVGKQNLITSLRESDFFYGKIHVAMNAAH